MISYIDILQSAMFAVVGVGYAVLVVWLQRVERLINALEISAEQQYRWLRLHSETISQIADGEHAPIAYPREELYKMYKEEMGENPDLEVKRKKWKLGKATMELTTKWRKQSK